MTSIDCADAFRKAGEFKQQGLKVNHIITDPPYNIRKATISATCTGRESTSENGTRGLT